MKKFIAVLLLLATVVVSAPAVVDACTYVADDKDKKCLTAAGFTSAAPASVSTGSKFTQEWNNLVTVLMNLLCSAYGDVYFFGYTIDTKVLYSGGYCGGPSL